MRTPINLDQLQLLPKDFGNGWMTKSAADLCRIAIAFAGFDKIELIAQINAIHRHKDRMVNAATIGNAMQMIKDRYEAEKCDL